jgi:hypothetical protein
MPDIGASLREARMRDRIDITEAEADTKIRGKYLRALENEEWDLLPGPTFVKSFLRTYGDYLGLDGRMLVEQFKLRYERPELQPIAPPRRDDRRGRDRRAGGRGVGARALVVAGLVLALLVGLFLLGRGGGDDEGGGGGATTTEPATTRERTTQRTTTERKASRPAVARLRIVPTGQVYVCLVAAGGRRLVDGVVLQPGEGGRTFRSSRFLLNLGNGDARLVVNGRSRAVPPARSGIGYEITPTRVRTLPSGKRPTCS